MKKFWLEIILVIIGILLLFSSDPDPHNTTFLRGVGFGMIVLAGIWFFFHRTHLKKEEEMKKKIRSSQKRFTEKSVESKVYPSTNVRKEEDERNKQIKRDEQVTRINEEVKNQIIDINDIRLFATTQLDRNDIDYIANKVTCPLFGGTVKDINDKIGDIALSENQIISILKDGTENLRERFINTYKDNSWTMSSTVFDYLLNSNKMILLQLVNYSAESFSKCINQLGPYELLGYRVDPRKPDEEVQGTFNNLLAKKEISYYEELDTDIVYIAEQHFSDNDAVRKLAFDKLFTGPCDLVDMIKRLDTLTEYEVRKIFERQHDDEISEMLDRADADTLVDYFPPKYVIKVMLGVLDSDYHDHINDNFDFQTIDKKIWIEIFEELTGDELSGYRMKSINQDEEPEGYFGDEDDEKYEENKIPYYGTGDDIISLIENKLNDDTTTAELRKLAFAKLADANDMNDAIESWDNIMDYEITKIMERENEGEIEALFNRDDTGDIIENLPDEYIIKARLGLFDFGDNDELSEEYNSRIEDEEFKAKVQNLVKNLIKEPKTMFEKIMRP